jgi:predicted tellurium resistance membrane protein TerC
MEWITQPEIWISLFTLTVLEIVLGIDNVIFISILAGKLPEAQRHKARQVGLSLALITRVLLLCSLAWMVKLTNPIFSIPEIALFGMHEAHPVSGRDLILLLGGLFLLGKATFEIHDKLEGEEHGGDSGKARSFSGVITQILILDIVFSLDSVITAVGMVKQLSVMVAAVTIALGFMLFFAKAISDFIESHPTLKILALSFLILIGFVLVLEGFHKEIPKGYIYFAMAFAFGVEMVNLKIRARQKETEPLHLRGGP